MVNSITIRNQNLNKVKSFIDRKLSTTPIIVERPDCVRVGKFKCQQDNGQWKVYLKDKLLEEFILKSSSVAWCIAIINNKYREANAIIRQDSLYARITEDAYIYKLRYKTTNDEFKKELMWIRYENTKYHQSSVKYRLTEFLKNIKLS